MAAALMTLAVLAGCDQDDSYDMDAGEDAVVDTPWDSTADPPGDVPVDGPVDSPVDGAVDTSPDAPPPGEPSFGSDATITDVHDMAGIVNDFRESYSTHDRYWGIPFGTGDYHTDVTWPLVLTWSDAAATTAQAEADAVAGGASPTGVDVVGGGYFWVDGVNTSPYMVTTGEHNMSTANTFGRMSIFYHDFGGRGPVLTRMGLGASAETDGSTVWVLVLTE
ncbi:MAG: hypothetical protein JRG91_11405 [Deltaproteobacteria bacterium]|nr:hypothetical protein [Deltaproteobacteria bacterium]